MPEGEFAARRGRFWLKTTQHGGGSEWALSVRAALGLNIIDLVPRTRLSDEKSPIHYRTIYAAQDRDLATARRNGRFRDDALQLSREYRDTKKFCKGAWTPKPGHL
jgi:hypothetical protein